MKIAVNRAHYPVTVLGPGQRIGIWLQGCSIRCKGCVSQDTWEHDPGKLMTVAALLAWCRRVATADQPEGRRTPRRGGPERSEGWGKAPHFSGVTISGGEPFDQPQALAALLKGLHDWRRSSGNDFDILCYSGYPLATLKKKHAKLLALLDAVIPEPYVDGLPLAKVWRGSANQPLTPLSPRGEARFGPHLESPAEAGRRMQVAAEGQRLWFIGIPDRGDMAELEALCRQRGLTLDAVSWR